MKTLLTDTRNLKTQMETDLEDIKTKHTAAMSKWADISAISEEEYQATETQLSQTEFVLSIIYRNFT